MYYSGDIPLKLESDDECRLLSALSGETDDKATDTLIEHNLRFVIYIAGRFEDSGVSQEELVSVGTVGLIKGVHAFRPEMGAKLATYLSHCIENEMRMYLRRVKREKRDLSIERTCFRDCYGRTYPLAEILGTDPDVIPHGVEKEEQHTALLEALGRLPQREQVIVRLRYGLDTEDEKGMTQQEIADLLGISQSYVSRLERRILIRLRREMADYR